MTLPLVSVVIPTRGRPQLVARAARSALGQTMSDIEVIAVFHGPEAETASALGDIRDRRLRLETLPRDVGAAAKRNAGVRAARGRWVAFLDDDDEWRASKLAVQLASAESSELEHPILASRVLVRDGRGPDRVWPRRLPAPGEPLSEYLFARRGLFWGEALVHTSTLVAGRYLLERVPFREDLARNEDHDWLLRATRVPGTGVVFAPSAEPLAIWHVEEDRPRASQEFDWEDSLAWIRSVRPLVTPRAYAGFLLGFAAAEAARQRRAAALPTLAVQAFRRGRPAPIDLLLAVGAWTVPPHVRRRVGAWRERHLGHDRHAAAPSSC